MNEQEMEQQIQQEIIPETAPESVPEPAPEPELVNPQPQPVYSEPASYVVPQDSPYSPLYNPNKDKKKKGNVITVILIALLGVFLVGALVFALSKVIESAVNEVQTASSERRDDIKSKLEEFLEEDEQEKDEDSDNDEDIYQQEEDNESDDQPQEWGHSSEDGYVPSASDDYYVELADTIDDSLSYKVTTKDYSYVDADENVEIYISYPVISKGNVRNQDKINEEIEEAAMYYVKQFASHPEAVSDCYIEVYGYVTYMDEDVLSIVLSEDCWLPDLIDYIDLYSINIDISSGQIMNNTGILEYTEKVGKEFRKQCEYQNGTVEFVDTLSDEEIADYLEDSETGVIFYTPVGLEIGFNYYYGDYPGWVTVTLKDYEKFIKKV